MPGPFPAPLPVTHSTPTAAAVAQFLAATYALPPPLECALLNRGFNDSYAVRDPPRANVR
jgi:hypothetical protein